MLCLEKLDKCQSQNTQTVTKRKKVNPYGSIVTSEKQFLDAEENKNVRNFSVAENCESESENSDTLTEDTTEESFTDSTDDEQEIFNQPVSS